MSLFRKAGGAVRKTTSSAMRMMQVSKQNTNSGGMYTGLNLNKFTKASQQEESEIEKDYVVGELVGQGSFASVWEVQSRETGEHFAMKTLLKCENSEWRKEVAMCRRVQDNPDTRTSRVMQIRDVYESREEAFIVSDLCTYLCILLSKHIFFLSLSSFFFFLNLQMSTYLLARFR